MKKSIVLMLGLILAAFATASADVKSYARGCRENLAKIDEKLSLNARIEQDLLQGIWVQQTGELLETLVQFTSSGDVVFLNATKMGAGFETLRFAWTVEVLHEEPVLLLRDLNSREVQRLRVEQTCQGIDLTDLASGELQSYRYVPASEKRMQQQQAGLTGRWENVLPEVTLINGCNNADQSLIKMDDVSFRFEFRPDGTFTRSLSSQVSDQHFEENGRWEVSKDGKHLLLHCKGIDGNTVTQCARIKHLEMDELVLEQPLTLVGRQFVSMANNDFFFNKN